MVGGRFVCYLRVSTERQGRSGLGLDAQRKAVFDYLRATGSEMLAEFVEIESGRRRDRPQLAAALDLCRRQRATLVIAKLDRLARNVAFVSTLLESKARFVAADMPEADTTFLQIAAVFGEWEAKRIAERTRAALAAAKAKGRKLGWAIPARREQQRVASRLGVEINIRKAEKFSANVQPIIQSLKSSGLSTLSSLAAALNNRGIRTARNGKWYPTTIKHVLSRVSAMPNTRERRP